jgi:hypothetical protein
MSPMPWLLYSWEGVCSAQPHVLVWMFQRRDKLLPLLGFESCIIQFIAKLLHWIRHPVFCYKEYMTWKHVHTQFKPLEMKITLNCIWKIWFVLHSKHAVSIPQTHQLMNSLMPCRLVHRHHCLSDGTIVQKYLFLFTSRQSIISQNTWINNSTMRNSDPITSYRCTGK